MRWFQSIAADTGGSEIAEAAMVLPLMFTLFIGIFWLGRAFSIHSAITQAAREGAHVAVSTSCATCAAPGCSLPGSSYPCDTTVVNAISSSLRAAKMNPAFVVAPSPALAPANFCASVVPAGACSTTSNITICRGVRLNPNTTPEQCGTIVAFRYPISMAPPLPYGPAGLQNQLKNLAISTQVEMRVEE